LLDILIPTHDRNTRLETCLYGLTLQEPNLPEGHRVIICDDASVVSAESTVYKFTPKLNIEFYRQDVNIGSAAVRRFLASKTKQRFVQWLDDDIVLHKDAIAMHLRGCSQPNPGVSVGTMENVLEDITDEILKLPLSERVAAGEQRALPEGRHQFKDPGSHTKAWGGAFTGNLMLLKEHGDKIGWLDEDVVGWGHDDTIMTVKLVGIGVPIWYDLHIRGWHLRQDRIRTGNLGRAYWDTAHQNEAIIERVKAKYNVTSAP
jgi:GT2 family glycosyltransferase